MSHATICARLAFFDYREEHEDHEEHEDQSVKLVELPGVSGGEIAERPCAQPETAGGAILVPTSLGLLLPVAATGSPDEIYARTSAALQTTCCRSGH